MTIKEFSNEFDIAYNSIATNSAPSIDLYEKSVYLTKAQLELVKNYFNPNGNKYKEGFEGSSKRRTDLNELVVPYKSLDEITSTSNINGDSQFFKIPSDTFLILQESAKVSSTDTCVNGSIINVVPKTHDEFNIQKDNPFRKPSKKVIWRLDLSSQIPGVKNVELLSAYNIIEYNMRYIKYPEPIILTDLTTTYPGEGLSIDGITSSQTSKLNKSIHREILDRAVEHALADYKPRGLATKAQLNQRNE